MRPYCNTRHAIFCASLFSLIVLSSTMPSQQARATPAIRTAFFTVYPEGVGTAIETVPSNLSHCGACHFSFDGGGPHNPYGERLHEIIDDFPNNPEGRQQAILSIEGEDSDEDGFTTLTEVTDLINFQNTPTFCGLTPANVNQVSEVDLSEIQEYLVPVENDDVTPPEVTVLTPNGGEVLTGNMGTTVTWIATDAESGVIAVDMLLSEDGGATFRTVAQTVSNTGSHTWFPPNRPTATAIFRIVAADGVGNTSHDDSDGVFTVEAPPGGIVQTTLRDFHHPGSQPFEGGAINPPDLCAVCHGNFDLEVEPYFNWQGSMMAIASKDLIFQAGMVIANQDAPDSGDLCLRCHTPTAWLRGRSIPTSGDEVLESDLTGISCDICHRMVDPFFDASENPPEDEAILANLASVPTEFTNSMYVADPTGTRRGPFKDADLGHPILVSPFHREAAICGTCHDLSNPIFDKDDKGNYVFNDFDEQAPDFSALTLMPIQRTYSEWYYSDYNTPEGVHAPPFAGNLDPPFVSSCQDCHMRDVTGQGCFFGPVREDLPLHDFTGASIWLPLLMAAVMPDEVNGPALQAGVIRARYMLENAAEMAVEVLDEQLLVTITNNSGHKLPTGYPDGRRMWINVKFFDAGMTQIAESGAYDLDTGVLTLDPEIKIYEVRPGLDETTAPLVGVDPGPSHHLMLNNKIFKDNRIPPRGFTNSAYKTFGGHPVDYTYQDGQYWDSSAYTIPAQATQAEVTLYYQSTTKEFIEFLRDENVTNSKGQELFDLWNDNGKCPPDLMLMETILFNQNCPADLNADKVINASDLAILLGAWGSNPGHPADFNGDEVVNAADLAVLLGSWGPCP